MKKVMLIGLVMMVLSIGGCVKTITTDANGVPHASYNIDPNKTAPFESGAEIGIVIANAAGTIWPIGTLIGGFLAGLVMTWRKYKPQLTASQESEMLAYNATESLVGLIDELKKVSPESWETLKKKFKIGPEVENVIRSIRGLPPLI